MRTTLALLKIPILTLAVLVACALEHAAAAAPVPELPVDVIVIGADTHEIMTSGDGLIEEVLPEADRYPGPAMPATVTDQAHVIPAPADLITTPRTPTAFRIKEDLPAPGVSTV